MVAGSKDKESLTPMLHVAYELTLHCRKEFIFLFSFQHKFSTQGTHCFERVDDETDGSSTC